MNIKWLNPRKDLKQEKVHVISYEEFLPKVI